MTTLKSIFASTLIFLLSISSIHAEGYELAPVNGSDLWLDGAEWAMQTKNGITIKILFDKNASSLNVFKIAISNSSDQHVNIDPDQIYYTPTKFDNRMILDGKEDSGPRRGSNVRPNNSVPDDVYLKNEKAKYDTVRIEKAKKLIRNQQLLSGLGFLFDSDNLAINRTQSKTDYYRSTILLKNTVYKDGALYKIFGIPQHDIIKELVLHIPIGNDLFKFTFEKIIIED